MNLNKYKGKWVVLYFYPKDMTSGCTIEAKDFTCLKKEFEKLNAVIIGVSPDTQDRHDKFTEKEKLTIDLIPDPEHKILEKWDVWKEKSMYGRKYMGVVRTTVLIDPKGKIVQRWDKVNVKDHAKEVLAKLKELSK